MPIINHLIAKGVPTGVASVIVGGTGDSTITAGTGTSQTTATLISSGAVYISIASASGRSVQLPVCDPDSSIDVFNGGGQAVNVYGQTNEQIQGGGANNKFTLPNNKMAQFKKFSSTVWGANLSN
jgi:hypothetical protein